MTIETKAYKEYVKKAYPIFKEENKLIRVGDFLEIPYVWGEVEKPYMEQPLIKEGDHNKTMVVTRVEESGDIYGLLAFKQDDNSHTKEIHLTQDNLGEYVRTETSLFADFLNQDDNIKVRKETHVKHTRYTPAFADTDEYKVETKIKIYDIKINKETLEILSK